MRFSESLKRARTSAGLTQAALAAKVGMTERTIQNYELGTRKPRDFKVVERLAEALGVDTDTLLSVADSFVVMARERGGASEARDVEKLVSEVSGLFAGGELEESEKDAIMSALNRAYWDAKEENRKYTPKKYIKP